LSSSSGYTASYCSCRCLEVSVRCLCLSVCLSGYSFDSFGRSFRTHLLGFKPADQDASCSLPIT
ncbi:hypothetical protein GQ42DRAFT_162962, partial [Ramicandelaber brevisporus]